MKKSKKNSKKKFSRFDKIIQDIKDVKIQGATAIAKKGIKAYFLKNNKESVNRIISARPTEPLLQNSIEILEKSKNKKTKSNKILNYIKKSQKIIAKKGSYLIKKNMNIFSHCHSTTVVEILKYARLKRKKSFVVYTTEVEPLLQGRQTATELAKFQIKTIVVPDLAAEQYLKKCDLFLFGADAFTKKGIVNKIGTSTLCKIAKEFHIPRYSCGISLKFTKKIKLEKRKSKEVWLERNKFIDVENPAFDFIKKDLLSGVISEFGIQSYRQFTKSAKQNLKNFTS
jgi:methylthioribose-1-phosphate isomerase